MDGARDDFLAGAALAGDEDVGLVRATRLISSVMWRACGLMPSRRLPESDWLTAAFNCWFSRRMSRSLIALCTAISSCSGSNGLVR